MNCKFYFFRWDEWINLVHLATKKLFFDKEITILTFSKTINKIIINSKPTKTYLFPYSLNFLFISLNLNNKIFLKLNTLLIY
jgi:hypothetical protein